MEEETPSRSRATDAVDPWVRRLIVAVLGVLVIVLVGVVYIVYTSVVIGQMPRTLVESEIAALDVKYCEAPTDPGVVSEYMFALISGERYSKARSVLRSYRAEETVGSPSVSVAEVACC